MKLFSWFIGLYLLLVASNVFGEDHIVIRKHNWQGANSYEIVSRQKNAELKNIARKESLQASKALKLSQKEWKQNKENSGSFPISATKPTKIKELKRFRDMTEASTAIQKYTDREAESIIKDENKLKRRYTKKSRSRNGKSKGNLDTKGYEKAVAKKNARDAKLESAHEIYSKHLKQCITEYDEKISKNEPLQ